jgi:hypothetical protein
MIKDFLGRMDKQPLDRGVGGHVATLLAAILAGWGQLSPAVAILLGLGLAVVVICCSETISSFLWPVYISAAIATEYFDRISRAAARAFIEALETADRVVQVLISAISFRALLRRFESHRIIHLGIAPRILPTPIF